jgi:glycosyltransferase involved in cell wall biosynthesis
VRDHILQVVTDTDRRGAQVFATDLHAALERRGLQVTTVALTTGKIGGLDLPVLGPSRTHPSTLRALARETRRAGVVAAHGSTTLPVCALVCPITRTPFVYRQISDSLFWASSRLRRLRVAVGLRAAARVVALWRGSASTLTGSFGVPERKIDVIPNGVPLDGFTPVGPSERSAARRQFGLPDDRPIVLSIGALVPEKGVDLAVRAMAAIPDAHLLVAGDGPERVRLSALASEVGCAATFLGSLTDPRPAYAAADLVTLPSRGGDSMPAVLIEAGLLAIPAVATPVEGIVDIVLDGRTGSLVPTDDVDALRRALQQMLSDPALIHRRGLEARDHCTSRFSIDVVAEQWEATLAIARTGRR